eukprot:CAMPEP_0202961618 /NCGR_PEP_ID=MMETSP1396-20130829/5693_1 /ASSEMBLY_ACC=CAM_ASM_000872 /TAXON_ID= /ORGANISM="Pseudokeronopsis sp., Strain Brazil" /LENGTH=49 /DNA_ID= /DNA_START= /DNA_END= /DNA_ORIENTATION=
MAKLEEVRPPGAIIEGELEGCNPDEEEEGPGIWKKREFREGSDSWGRFC